MAGTGRLLWDLIAKGVYVSQDPGPDVMAAIGRIRYQRLVVENKISKAIRVADHDAQTYLDPLDGSPSTWQVYSLDSDGEVDAALRMVIHPERGMSEEDRLLFEVDLPEDLAALLRQTRTAELGRLVARHDARGGGRAMVPLARRLIGLLAQERIQIVFGLCRTDLLGHYIPMGYRPYTTSLPETEDGARHVLLANPWELSRYRGGGRFLWPWALYHRDPASGLGPIDLGENVAGELALVIDHGQAVEHIEDLLSRSEGARRFLDGLTHEDILALEELNLLVRFARGQAIIRQKIPDLSGYLLVEGEVSIRTDGAEVATRRDGAVIGELAFLLRERRRTADVIVTSEHARVIVLNWHRLQRLGRRRKHIADILLRNLSVVIAEKLAETNQDNARLKAELERLTSTDPGSS